MYQISVVLPNTFTIPESLLDPLSEDSDYYRIDALRASDLVNREFIEAFVKKGKLLITFITKSLIVAFRKTI